MRLKVFCGLLFSASMAWPAIVTVPAGLHAGDVYHLVFVTAGVRDATSTDIAVYNQFVTIQANLSAELAALGTSWRVIGSTPTVSSVVNTGITGAIYRLDGTLVAAGASDLFDGSLLAPILIDQTGAALSVVVYTGSDASGGPFYQLGSFFESESNTGLSSLSDSRWISDHHVMGINSHHFYAVSGPIVVTPEPNAVWMSSLIIAYLVWRRTFAGFPATTIPSGTSRTTTAPMPSRD